MGRLVILASGSGSNFEAIVQAIRAEGRHRVQGLVCDRPGAGVLSRAARLGVPSVLVDYSGKGRAKAELDISRALDDWQADLVALAGFMRLLSPDFVSRYAGRLVNIHPSLLPRWPGLRSIERAWAAGDSELGISIHQVDAGMDTGVLILQAGVERQASLEATEAAIHALEHLHYPAVIQAMLDGRAP